ncbi:MBL fold metallo-hydrolase [Kineothrix alysoides]|nr:MBL fold metallo-hydrolase [Kineothrix alysoides]
MIILIIVIALALLAATIIPFNEYPVLFMKPSKTGKIQDSEILAVKNKIGNMYFINSSDGYILIDAGSDIKAVEKIIQQENISDVRHIFLTHSDHDHVASLGLFTDANIYMGEDELQMVNGETKRERNKNNSLPDGIGLDDLILLKDEQKIKIGEHTIRCVKAPGHTTGSMIYILDNDYIFLGDSCKISNNKLDIHPFTMDEALSRESIQKISKLIKGTEFTLTSHYGHYKSSDLVIDQ